MFLERRPKINVQRLFGLALSLKVISSIASVLLNSPWILGLVIPLGVMLCYMFVGFYCRQADVSEERFADSCYYIGFIFTITSIIVSLFDLPNLAGADGMRNIALRFGSAMVSTVLGMGVRVYLVSFRKDADDAVRDAEEAVLDAVRMFVTQLNSVVDNLKQFEQQVIDAAKLTVENVNQQVDAIGHEYAQSLNNFYNKLTEENKTAFAALIQEVRTATTRLADSVDTYSGGMKSNLEGIERKVTEFADAVTKRLTTTTFPDDYFARELKAPLELLKNEAVVLGQSVRIVSSEVGTSSEVISELLKKITTKTKKTEAAMDAVVALSEQHASIVNNADLQLRSLVSLAARLEQVERTLQGAAQTMDASSHASSELLTKVASLAYESSVLRFEIKDVIAGLTTKLDANVTLASGVIEKLESQAGELRGSASEVIARLEGYAASNGLIAQRMGDTSAAIESATKQLSRFSTGNTELATNARDAANTATAAVQSSNQAVQNVIEASQSITSTKIQVADIANRLEVIDTTLRSHTTDLLDATNKLQIAHETHAVLVTNAVIDAMTDHAAVAMAARVEVNSEPGQLKIVEVDGEHNTITSPKPESDQTMASDSVSTTLPSRI